MKLQNRNRLNSVLGLKVAEGQLRACRAVRAKGGIEIDKSANAPLSLDVLHPDPELVGRELKNVFDGAGIRERNCILALPARWVMTQHTKLPDLTGDDLEGFLQIEAEKGFPVDPAQLQIARSFQTTAEGRYVTQLAVRKEQLEQIAAVLRAAGLKPVSFSLGLAVLPGAIPPAGTGRITLAIDSAGVTLLVAAGGGIAAFRTFDARIESEAGDKLINTAAVGRELRITLEQIPADLRAEIREIFLTGDSAMARQVAEGLAEWARQAGIRIERGDLPEKNLAAELAERLAVHRLENDASALEFLPPRPSRWAMMMQRYTSKRLATAGFAVGAAAVIALCAFGWQEYQRFTLRSEWNSMAAQVNDLNAVEARIREFRPFYDTSFRTLTIMKRITECFPDNGTVTAKTVEIHGNSIVSISGSARDNAALLRTLDQLRKAREVQGLKVEQMRGKQFNFTFRWNANSGT